jgi:PAS domain S-box-containing protein
MHGVLAARLIPYSSVLTSLDSFLIPVVLGWRPDIGTVLSLALIASGAVVMLYAATWMRRLVYATHDTPMQRTWQVLFGLMLLFIVGYLSTIGLVWTRNVDALVLVVGSVFFGGAAFVLLVVRTSQNTIERLIETTVSRDFLDDVLASMGDGLLIVSKEGYVEEVNPAAIELFDCDYETIIGTKLNTLFANDAFSPDDKDDSPSTNGEATVVTNADETVPVLFSASSLSSNGTDGRVIVCTVRDISRRKRRELELQRQNERLDEFASVISHDLRNPLGIAQGHLELARETGDSKHFQTAERALDRIENLIEGLLGLARQGQTVDDVHPVQLGEVAEKAWRTVDTADATLRTDDGLGAVWADEDRLRQALENLFRNSVEHGGSTVTVTMGSLPGESGFYIEDDGPGVPPDDRTDVFENGYTTEENGTGFGLSIVQTIFEAHGWDVSLTEGTEGGARIETRTSKAVVSTDKTGAAA